MPDSRVALAFDFGLRRIGVAVGQRITQTATPLKLLNAQAGIPNWSEIQFLIKEWGVTAFVVGLPLNLDNTEQHISLAARAFAKELETRFTLPTYLVDERYSSREAKSQLREHIDSADISVDSYAAKLILESWLNNR